MIDARRATTGLLFLMAGVSVSSAAAGADIYRCTDPDGGVVFKQTPCAAEPSDPQTTEETGQPAPQCDYANRFAFETGRLMRAGLRLDELFNRYGGVDALSRPALGVINYVYSFRTNDDVSVERIASLAETKCRARVFGQVACAALPTAFTDNIGGCDGAAGSTAPASITGTAPSPAPALENAREQAAEALGEEAVTECKQAYRDQIDAIDVEMRSGYSAEEGERYKERLLSLTERMRQCER
ncbi:MAG: DUF4124 domain-containing protein [Woeseiaceae bacterium]